MPSPPLKVKPAGADSVDSTGAESLAPCGVADVRDHLSASSSDLRSCIVRASCFRSSCNAATVARSVDTSCCKRSEFS